MTYSRNALPHQNFRCDVAKRGEIFPVKFRGRGTKISSPKTKVQRIGFNFCFLLTHLSLLCRLLGWVKPFEEIGLTLVRRNDEW